MSETENPLREAIAEAIRDNEVILFMKGVPEAPACGFSARATACLQALDVAFAAVDVLPDPRIRQELSALSNWPTIPQLFVKGELIGGSDIIMEMYESGELAQALGTDAPDAPDGRRADEHEVVPAQRGVGRHAHADGSREATAEDALERQAHAHLAPAAHHPRGVGAQQVGLAQPALEGHADGEPGDVHLAEL